MAKKDFSNANDSSTAVSDESSDTVAADINAQLSPGEQQRQALVNATAERAGQSDAAARSLAQAEHAKHQPAHGAHIAPFIQVKGGEVSIANFHLLHIGVDVGTEENNISASYAPGTLKAIKFKARDITGRQKLAAIFQGAAAELLK